MHVLIVFSKQDTALREQIEDEALQGLVDREGRPVVVYSARNHADAVAGQAEVGAQFVIVGHALARDSRTPVQETGGIELCETLRGRGLTCPMILLVPHVTSLTNNLLARCVSAAVTPYHTGGEVLDLVRQQVRAYRPPPKVLDVVLTLRPDSNWEYSLIGTNFKYQRTGYLKLSAELLDKARALTRFIGMAPAAGWYEFFRDLGTSLSAGLCEATKFGLDLEHGLELAGGIEQARISFSLDMVDRTHFPIALEALFPPPSFPEVPWMVRAPLYRNLGPGHSLGNPLFGTGVPPLKILLIGADAHGHVNDVAGANGKALFLNRLGAVHRECEGVRRCFRRNIDDRSVHALEYVKGGEGASLSRRQFLNTLEAGDWSVVHFAGHSFAREDGSKENRGYIFVGGPDRPEAIEIDEIASLLRRTTLVYLSSCESSSQTFATELARHVPVVIGFRWKVDDTFAALHAHLFYRYLLRERRIETAFLQTRRAIHQRYSQRERVWASSMLVFGRVH
jgi:hypothetical protein